MISLTAHTVYVTIVYVTANHYLWLYVITEKACPFSIGILFNIERRRELSRKGIMTDNDPVLNALCSVFAMSIIYYIFYKFGLTAAKAFTGYGKAIFGIAVGLVLSAVKNYTPKTSETEAEKGISVLYRGMLGYAFGIDTPHIVVPT